MQQYNDIEGYNYYKAFEADRVRIASFARYVPSECHHPSYKSHKTIHTNLVNYHILRCSRCGCQRFIPYGKMTGICYLTSDLLNFSDFFFEKLLKPYLEHING